ncbi:threonine--tRNA ligase [Patescibacteria group bacterium]|nr:threonine--tRNA ligase [Patescibacteria group bacterium]
MSQDKLTILRNSTEHILTMAMEELYGQDKIIKAMGPATNDGFYFDFDSKKSLKISKDYFPQIEKQIQKLIQLNLPITTKFVSEKIAREMFKDNKYKQAWIDEIITKDKKIRIVTIGEKGTGHYFPDICKDNHLKSTGTIKAFKLLSIAGAYWHGDEKNKMLTRIYGTAFESKQDLKKHLWQLDEAKKRDHRKLGKELDLFVISDDIGKGLPLLTPNGTVIKNQILAYERELENKAGFQEVTTPHIAKNDLYKRTGHWQHYKDVMYAPFGIDDETYVLKPMNCPHHYMIYESKPRSYKDLPIRLSEPGTCYRYEKTGELSGLTRVRALTIDDSHILMTEDQIEAEFDLCIDMVIKMFKSFGLNNYSVRLSLNDPDDNLKYIADPKIWKLAGEKLKKIVKKNKLKCEVATGEASFYGPKIDFMVKDAIGREWQMSTLQLDLFMAKRLGLTYTDKDGQKKHPIILHRGLTGSLERTLGLLIEHFAGAFPVWLSPVQVTIITISDKQNKYAKEVVDTLKEEGIRVSLDDRSETLGSKIRDAETQKTPYVLIIGDKEVVTKKVSIRQRKIGNIGTSTINKFIEKIKQEIEDKLIN